MLKRKGDGHCHMKVGCCQDELNFKSGNREPMGRLEGYVPKA